MRKVNLSDWDANLTIRENAEALGITINHAWKLAGKHRLGTFSGHKRRKPVPKLLVPRPGTISAKIYDSYINNKPLTGFHITRIREVIARYGGK